MATHSNEVSALLHDLEGYANKAVAEVKLIGDRLAQGLAYEQFGIALHDVFERKDQVVQIKLDRAIEALQESIKKLQLGGFYRGTGEAFLILSRCKFALWEKNSDMKNLNEAVQSLTQGLISTATGIKDSRSLENLYSQLSSQLEALL